ncbi:hypothetical protein I5Q31_11075 [Serratia marcescens]|nr:hypothetical protein [Serratia marcescens]
MTERYGSIKRVLAMVVGALPGILLCGIVGEQVRAEMFLPSQSLTVSGEVMAPSCTARLEDDRVEFRLGPEAGATPLTRSLRLHLSACEVDEVGVTLRARHWPDLPNRGSLTDPQTQRRSLAWYYTVGPDLTAIRLSVDSPALLNDRGVATDGRYFALSDVTYWLGIRDEVTVPLTVEVHREAGVSNAQTPLSMTETFMLTVSYR